MHYIYVLQEMNAISPRDHPILAPTLQGLLESISKWILGLRQYLIGPSKLPTDRTQTQTRQRQALTLGQPGDNISSESQLVRSLIPLLLSSFHDSGQIDATTAPQGRLIYKVISIFKDVIETILHESITTEMQPMPISRLNTPRRTRRQAPSATEIQIDDPSVALEELCDIGVTIMRSLDITNPPHLSILEGCHFILLKEAGQRLRGLVFGSHIAKEIRPSGSSVVAGQLNDHVSQGEGVEQNVSLHAKTAAKYLVSMLQRTPHLSRAFESTNANTNSPLSSQSTRDDSPLPPRDHPSKTFINHAASRFQNTLIRAVFGEERPGIFEPSLKLVEPPNLIDPEISFGAEYTVKDWFTHEIWQLVGWEVLQEYL